MQYQDFSSLVQLGVGLHAGTALLQIYGEIGTQPLVRTLNRIRRVFHESDADQEALVDDLDQLESEFEIFRIQLFNEFKKYVIVNSIVAAMLVLLLVFISYLSAAILPAELSVLFVFLSIFPASITLGLLWSQASGHLRPLKNRADTLERKALGLQ